MTINQAVSRHRIRTLAVSATALAMGVVLTACGGSGSNGGSSSSPGVTKDEIVLGGTTPLTGPVAANCGRLTGASSAWFEKVNADGGIHGRKIVWKPLDDGYDLARAGANAKKLVAGDYFAIFGGCGTIQPPAVVAQAERAKVPYLWPTAQTSVLYAQGNKVTFGFSPSYIALFAGLVPWAFEEYGAGKVAILMHQAAGIEDAVAEVKKVVEAGGGEVVSEDVLPADTSDLTPYVLKLKKTSPDYVVTSLPGSTGLRFALAAIDQNFKPGKKYINAISWMAADFTDPLKVNGGPQTQLDGQVISAYQVLPPEDPAEAECVAASAKYQPGVSVGADMMAGCNSAQWMTAALDKVGPNLTREKLVETLEAMKDVQLSPGTAPVTMSKDRHLTPSAFFAFELIDGTYKKVAEVPLDGKK